MNWIQVETEGGAAAFRPGDVIAGRVRWQLGEAPESVELRLFWYTEGRGTQDLEIVETLTFANPAAEDRRSFQIRVPKGPFSCSGKLLSLIWALEAVAQPTEDSGRTLITISPTGEEILLHGRMVPRAG
jgi:hypothetical protein